MKKIKIKHIPKCVDIAMVVLCVMVCAISLSLKGIKKPDIGEMWIMLTFFGLFIAGIILAATVKTVVQFGEGSIIRCRWLFLFWKIDLESVTAVSYTLRSHMTRGGGRCYSVHMMFYTGREQCRVLKEHLHYKIAEECIRHRFDRVQLMQLYRYIEETAPEKAVGFE